MTPDPTKQDAILIAETEELLTFLARKAGTGRWVVSGRMTQRLRDKGYELAIHPKTYSKWMAEFERRAAP